MDELDERPAVPPRDEGGDERLGWWAAGGILTAGGFGVLVSLNILLHRVAPPDGLAFGPVRIYPTLGPFAEFAIALGVIVGTIGVVLLYFAANAPRGPFVLPGEPY